MLTVLTGAIEARDPYTQGHSARVTALAEEIALRLGWSEERLESLRVGGPLHDIGKLAVSDHVLRKEGSLEEHELAEIRKHPKAGARLIAPVRPAEDALPYVLYHHERWDGRGYPTQRHGAHVPQGARLLAVVDAFDAMTSTRPYRRALPTLHALSEIERCAGTQFDPDLAHAFLRAWSAGAFADAVAM